MVTYLLFIVFLLPLGVYLFLALAYPKINFSRKKKAYPLKLPTKWKDHYVNYLVYYQYDKADSDMLVYIDHFDDIDWQTGHDDDLNNPEKSDDEKTATEGDVGSHAASPPNEDSHSAHAIPPPNEDSNAALLPDEDSHTAPATPPSQADGSPSAISQASGKILSRIARGEINVRNWNTDLKLQVKRLLGEAIVRVLSDDEEDANKMCDYAEWFIKKKTPEVSRYWIITFSFWATYTLVGLSFFIFLYAHRPDCPYKDHVMPLAIAMAFGGLGAFFSLLTRSGKYNYDSMSEKTLHCLEAMGRIAAGVISGVMAFILVKLEIIFPSMFTVSCLYSVSAIAFVAGFSERFIPRIILSIEDMQAKNPNNTQVNPE